MIVECIEGLPKANKSLERSVGPITQRSTKALGVCLEASHDSAKQGLRESLTGCALQDFSVATLMGPGPALLTRPFVCNIGQLIK